MATSRPFRNSEASGKRIESWIIGHVLREGLDVYVPMVDDRAVDAVERRRDGSFAEVQIKARSKDIVDRDAALFAGIPHEKKRDDYWFVFHSDRLDTKWIMSSEEFLREACRTKSGKNAGLCSIGFNGMRRDRYSGQVQGYVLERFETHVQKDFRRLQGE